LTDGKEDITISSDGDADSGTVTITPAGTLPGAGVASKSFTVTSAGLGDQTVQVTTVTAPSSSSVIKAGASATAKTVDKAVTSYTFKVSGWTKDKAYRVKMLVTDVSGGNNLSATVDGTSQAANALAAVTRTGISDGSDLIYTITSVEPLQQLTRLKLTVMEIMTIQIHQTWSLRLLLLHTQYL